MLWESWCQTEQWILILVVCCITTRCKAHYNGCTSLVDFVTSCSNRGALLVEGERGVHDAISLNLYSCHLAIFLRFTCCHQSFMHYHVACSQFHSLFLPSIVISLCLCHRCNAVLFIGICPNGTSVGSLGYVHTACAGAGESILGTDRFWGSTRVAKNARRLFREFKMNEKIIKGKYVRHLIFMLICRNW